MSITPEYKNDLFNSEMEIFIQLSKPSDKKRNKQEIYKHVIPFIHGRENNVYQNFNLNLVILHSFTFLTK
jgi:hypothetical protein